MGQYQSLPVLQQDVATKQAKVELDKAFAEQEQLAASLTASHSRPHQVLFLLLHPTTSSDTTVMVLSSSPDTEAALSCTWRPSASLHAA